MKHTPGPWTYDGEYIWADAIEGYVANPRTEDMGSGNVVPLRDVSATIDANALLMRAAPTMLEAFLRILDFTDAEMGDGDAARELAKQMISLATTPD